MKIDFTTDRTDHRYFLKMRIPTSSGSIKWVKRRFFEFRWAEKKPPFLASAVSEGIADFFSKTQARGKRILLARSNQASDLLEEKLKALGAVVSTLRLYDSSLPSDERSVSEFLRELKAGNVNATLFTSALSAANLFIMSEPHLDAMELRRLLRNTLVGAIGPVTSERLIILGVNPDLVPKRFLIEEGIANIIDAVETRAHAVSQ